MLRVRGNHSLPRARRCDAQRTAIEARPTPGTASTAYEDVSWMARRRGHLPHLGARALSAQPRARTAARAALSLAARLRVGDRRLRTGADSARAACRRA